MFVIKVLVNQDFDAGLIFTLTTTPLPTSHGFLTTCLKHDVIPIISWVHHDAEAYATEEDFEAYMNWWTAVARQLKDRDY